MTLAIMQPYLLPYIGYWQLINRADTFVIYDDVTYIKKGYINRNSILENGQSKSFTLELRGASSNRLINEIEVGNNANRLLKTIRQNYKKAPYFKTVFPMLENILEHEEKNLAKYLGNSLFDIADYLGIKTKIIFSSSIEKESGLRGEAKVIDICKRLGATDYINPIGGQGLYDKESFMDHGLGLDFIKSDFDVYKQFDGDFVSHLSIIDIMMFNSKETIAQMLDSHERLDEYSTLTSAALRQEHRSTEGKYESH